MNQFPLDKSDNPFRDGAPASSEQTFSLTAGASQGANRFGEPAAGPPRGMVGHVAILGSLMLGQAALFLLFGSFSLLFVTMFSLIDMPAQNGADARMVIFIYGFVAAITLPLGILHAVAGICVFRFKARVFGFVTVLLGLMGIATGLCAPTAIGLAVYGLVVLVNDSVVLAFGLAKQGKTRAEILQMFPAV